MNETLERFSLGKIGVGTTVAKRLDREEFSETLHSSGQFEPAGTFMPEGGGRCLAIKISDELSEKMGIESGKT